MTIGNVDNTRIPAIIGSFSGQVNTVESRVRPALGFILFLASGLIAPPALSAPGQSRKDGDPVLSDMRAHLFHNKTAQLSENVLDPKYRGSWNSIAGPNAANATLIVVEVSGLSTGTYSVHLVARETGRRPKLLLDRTQVVPSANDHGKVYLPFLMHQTGCAPVHLTARLAGVRPGTPLERTLAFACGE